MRNEKYETHASGLADGQVALVRPLRVEPGRTRPDCVGAGCQDNLQPAPSEQPPSRRRHANDPHQIIGGLNELSRFWGEFAVVSAICLVWWV